MKAAILSVAAFSVGLAFADFAIVEDGRARCSVVATGNRQVDADIAFFTNGIARMSGAELVVVQSGSCRKDVSDSALPLQLGTTTNRIVFDVREADLFHEDDYAVEFPDEKTMKIVGSEMSCRWALNQILEEQGAVFCMPGPHGTHWPQKTNLSVERVRRTAPASMIRLERYVISENALWLRANGGKQQKGKFFYHNMADMFPLEKYGKEPWCSKLMPMKNGVRSCPRDAQYAWQPCFSAEESAVEAIRIVCDYLDGHPDEKVYSLAVNDHEGYCECDGCKAQNGGSFEVRSDYLRLRSFSPAYYTWVNKVARGVAKRHPHVLLGLLAYCGLIDPPPFKLEDNVVPYFCFDIQQFADAKVGANRRQLIADWSKKAKHVGIWDYSFCMPYYTCFREYPDEQQRFFSLKREDCPSLDGFFTEGRSADFASEARRRYLFLRLAFDTTREPAAEFGRWYRGCVGEAAADDLRAYYGLWDAFWRSPALKRTLWYTSGVRGTYFPYSDMSYLAALDEETRQRADALMMSVLKKTEASGTEDQKIRARKLKNMHDFFAARQIECGVGVVASDGKVTKEVAERYLTALPKMKDAERERTEALERVIVDIRESAMRFVRGHEDDLRRKVLNPNGPLFQNGVLQHVGAERLCEAMNCRIGTSNVAERLTAESWLPQRRGLDVTAAEPVDGTPRWQLTATKGWQAAFGCLKDLMPRMTYLVSARFTNPTAHRVPIDVSLYSARPTNFASWDLGTHASAVLEPGETKTLTALHVLHFKTSAGKIALEVRELKPGEHVFVDSVTLREVRSAASGRPFAPGARVAFVGDSITHHGQYLRYLNLFYATRFPGSGIRLFNCGINGDATGAVQMRLDEDVCALKPTDVSFMLGMNDANSERMAESYEPNFRKVVEIVRTGCPDVRFHWMLPTIYDATATAGTTNNAVWRAERVNDVAVPAMRRLAKETDGRILDVNGDMRVWTARLQAENPKASLVSGDRCHPDRRGGFFIAWSYLRNQCVEPCLDRIVRDAEGKDALAFTLTEKALPYPVDPAAGDLAAKLPLDQICREEFKVANLVPGRYTLILDDQPVGMYSSEALARGVDLARNSATPQYRQALEVLKLVDARNEAEVHYRNLVWVWRMLKIRKVDFADAKAVRDYYESQPEKARKTGWLKFVPEWLEQWPRRADILADLERRMREIERAAKPVAHTWSLRVSM